MSTKNRFMEGFNYTNIFETKGIEYIAIIVFFIVLIPFWIILNRNGAVTKKIQKVLRVFSFDILKIPQGIYHGKNHTWAFLEKSGTALLGIDDFIFHTTGVVQLKSHKAPGDTICKGELMTELIREEKSLRIYSPVSGKIVSKNERLNDTPELLNFDPYGQGWIYKIKPSNWIEDTKSCYLAEEATAWSKMELARLKEFIVQSNQNKSAEPSLLILQDGGELIDHSLSDLPDDVWIDFQKNFLDETSMPLS